MVLGTKIWNNLSYWNHFSNNCFAILRFLVVILLACLIYAMYFILFSFSFSFPQLVKHLISSNGGNLNWKSKGLKVKKWLICSMVNRSNSERLRGFGNGLTDRQTDICNCRGIFRGGYWSFSLCQVVLIKKTSILCRIR